MTDDSINKQIDDDEVTEVLVTAESQVLSPGDKSKKKKLKKGVFNREWLKVLEYEPFLKEYKPDSSQATCIACNQ